MISRHSLFTSSLLNHNQWEKLWKVSLSTSKFENGLDIRSYLYKINFVTMTEFIHKVYSLTECIINVLWMKLFKVWNWPISPT